MSQVYHLGHNWKVSTWTKLLFFGNPWSCALPHDPKISKTCQIFRLTSKLKPKFLENYRCDFFHKALNSKFSPVEGEFIGKKDRRMISDSVLVEQFTHVVDSSIQKSFLDSSDGSSERSKTLE